MFDEGGNCCAYRKPRPAHYGSRRAHVTHVTQLLCILLISNVLLVLARHRVAVGRVGNRAATLFQFTTS